MSFRSGAIGLAKRAMPGRARIRLGAVAASALIAGAVALAAPATASASGVAAAVTQLLPAGPFTCCR